MKNGFIAKASKVHSTCKMCSRTFPNDQLKNSDPSRNHIYTHLREQVKGRESFQPASQNTEDRMEAYRRHHVWVEKENKKTVYTNPSTEADLREIYCAEAESE